MTVVFATDIFLNFRTGICYCGTILQKPSLIAYYYLTTLFTVDMLATIPWQAIVNATGDAGLRVPPTSRRRIRWGRQLQISV